MATLEIWMYRDESFGTINLAGYKVEALDGSIGKIDKASNEVGSSYIVVDTGPWILGKKAMLPAGVITAIDLDTETVSVNRTKDQVKNSPGFDRETYEDEKRAEITNYYETGAAGRHDERA